MVRSSAFGRRTRGDPCNPGCCGKDESRQEADQGLIDRASNTKGNNPRSIETADHVSPRFRSDDRPRRDAGDALLMDQYRKAKGLPHRQKQYGRSRRPCSFLAGAANHVIVSLRILATLWLHFCGFLAGPLPMNLSGLESAEVIETKAVRAVPI